MAHNEKQRQQKLMKKRQKLKNKRKQAARSGAANKDKAVIRRANRFPIHECLINREWQTGGMAAIAVSRRQSQVSVILGVFVVDLFCMGVKNSMCASGMSMSRYVDDFRPRFIEENDAVRCPVELAHQIVYGALAYAQSLGLHPHASFSLSRHVLPDPDEVPANDSLAFGKDGKPFYVAGPRNPAGKIMTHLERKLGRDGFHFVCEANQLSGYAEYNDEC